MEMTYGAWVSGMWIRLPVEREVKTLACFP